MSEKVVKFDAENGKKLDQMNRDGSWMNKLRRSAKTDALKTNSLVNIELILENDMELKDLFQFNEFTTEIDVVKPNQKLHFQVGQLVDAYLDQIASYIEEKPS